VEQVWGREGWHWWEEGGGGERGRRMNVMQIMYTQVCKCKMMLVQTVLEIR
jgi:hypothetical protein